MINRQLVNQPLGINQQQQKRKYLKSTLALCKQPCSSKDKQPEFCIILFTSTNKTGVKYPVKENVSQILIRFIHEGKATLQFKQPAHDLFIQATVPQLKQFLTLLKKILQNKLTAADMKSSGVSGIGVTALDHKTVAPTKLTIKNRSEYPVKGFPVTLEVLHINDVRRLGFDRGILKLLNLRVLDLSNNLIEFLPEELNKLPNLVEINLKGNLFGKSAPRKWDWMGGNLSRTLRALNVSKNELKYLPNQLLRLHALVTLNIDDNQLRFLPSGIGNLRNLRIFTASNNQLVSFPGSIKKLILDELDVSSNASNVEMNDVQRNIFAAQFPKALPVLTLKEYAGRKVLFDRLPYCKKTLPQIIINYLETARYCVCGKACFDKYVAHKDIMWLENITRELRSSRETGGFVPVDLYFCSLQCFARSQRRRMLVR